MKIIKLNLKERSYRIVIGANTLRSLGQFIQKLKLGTDAYVITNSTVKNKYGRLLSDALMRSHLKVKFKLVADSEKSKSLETAYSVIADLIGFDKKRRVFIIAFGGGVVGDLAGFVASVYKRGIPYIQIPTTLLAQVDSAIGGKTAVDLATGKNLVGAFYQPRLVLSDIDFLKTLSPRQRRAGLAEVIKYGIIQDPKLFNFLERYADELLLLPQDGFEFIVARCSAIKARVVEQDEKETRGIRTVLNFGHTLGHALEAASGYQGYNHGEAVALGMLLACDLSTKISLLSVRKAARIEKLIKKVGLPTKIGRVSLNQVIKAHYRDKKFIGQRNRFVLLKDIGKTKIVDNVSLSVIKEALKKRRA